MNTIQHILDWIRNDAKANQVKGVRFLPAPPSDLIAHMKRGLTQPCPANLLEFYGLCNGVIFGDFEVTPVEQVYTPDEDGHGVTVHLWGTGDTDYINITSPEFPIGAVISSNHDLGVTKVVAPSFETWLVMLYMEYRATGAVAGGTFKGVY